MGGLWMRKKDSGEKRIVDNDEWREREGTVMVNKQTHVPL
jgi:hypothetical protein